MPNIRFLIPVLLLLAAAAAVPGLALDQAAIEAEAKQLENMIIAPCCWRQPVAVHYSPSADEIRKDVRQKLAAGMSRQAILDDYVARYGEKILSKPPARGFGRLAYFLPVIVLAAGAAVAIVVIRRLRPAETATPEAVAPAASAAYSARLDKELWG